VKRLGSAIVLTVSLVTLCLVLVLPCSCSSSGPPGIVGSWTKSGGDWDKTFVFNSDGTFGLTFDCREGVEIDPNYMYGTYSLSGSLLHMEVHEDFMGTTREVDYECTLTESKMILVSHGYTEEYRRK
jgi:Lipocalin-like domain